MKNNAKRIFLFNKSLYESGDVVRAYSQTPYLQEPEKVILEQYEFRLKHMKMLDIGVGGGRTTHFFAPLVKEYIAVDYSEQMINVCKQRFPDLARDGRFSVCDARSLKMFQDDYFDFILFSFNGIDYVAHEERLQVLSEVHRVCRPGGLFSFSTHNLDSVTKMLSIEISLSPINLLRQIRRAMRFRFYNRGITRRYLQSAKHATIYGASSRFKHMECFVTLEEQIRQLSSGFENIRVYSLTGGREIDPSQSDKVTDPMLQFLCIVR